MVTPPGTGAFPPLSSLLETRAADVADSSLRVAAAHVCGAQASDPNRWLHHPKRKPRETERRGADDPSACRTMTTRRRDSISLLSAFKRLSVSWATFLRERWSSIRRGGWCKKSGIDSRLIVPVLRWTSSLSCLTTFTALCVWGDSSVQICHHGELCSRGREIRLEALQGPLVAAQLLRACHTR
jgi:hypothetical protein